MFESGSDGFFTGLNEGDFFGVDRMVLSVDEFDGEVRDGVSGERAAFHAVDDAFFDGGNELSWDGATDDFVDEFEPFAASEGFDIDVADAELSGTAGLFFVFTFDVLDAFFEGFSVSDEGERDVDFEFEFTFEFFDGHVEVLLSHASEGECAPEFVISRGQRRIFVDEFVDGDLELVFLAFGFARDVEVHHGCGIDDGFEGEVGVGGEGVVGPCVFEFGDAENIAEDAFFDGISVVSAQDVHGTESLRVSGTEVYGCAVFGDGAGHDAENSLFSGALVKEGTNDEGGKGVVGRTCVIFFGAVANDFDLGTLHGTGGVFGDGFEEKIDADQICGGRIEDWDELCGLAGGGKGGEAFFVRKLHRLKVFVHEDVVGFGDGFDEGFPRGFDGGFILGGDGRFFGFSGGPVIDERLVVDERNDALEGFCGPHGDLQLHGGDAEFFFDVGQACGDVGAFFVHFVDDEDACQA